MSRKGGYVYLLCDASSELFKIGVTRGSIENRIRKLQTGNGNEIFVCQSFKTDHPFKMEKMLHSKYYSKRQLNEWFALDEEDVRSFIGNCEKFQHNMDVLKDNPFF